MRSHPRHPRIHDGRAHPRPHRAAALVAGAAALTTTLLATGCSGPAATTAAQDTTFDAVAFRLGPRGDVQLSGPSRTAITPAGSYPVTAGRAHLFTQPVGSLLVVLRHWPDTGTERASRGRARRMPPLEEAAVETGFLVDTEGWARAELDGHPLQWLRHATLRIDTTNTAAGDLARLTLSGPHGVGPDSPRRRPTTRPARGSTAGPTAAWSSRRWRPARRSGQRWRGCGSSASTSSTPPCPAPGAPARSPAP